MVRNNFIDLVIGGPDLSGTSTQVKDIMEYFSNKGLVIRDIRGTDQEALFHSVLFKKINKNFVSFKEFLKSPLTSKKTIDNFFLDVHSLLFDGGTNQDLRVASMVDNKITTYIDPDSADVWVMEEPTKRGAGQVCRVIEQNRSKFGYTLNPKAAAEAHSVYRTDEFLRFRRILREKNKIIIRSRSEESCCYQIFDEKKLSIGVDRNYYLNLSGHKIAFGNPPSHVFIVCGPESWKEKDYLDLKVQRSGKDRSEDDHEKMAEYQILVNSRYAGSWIDDFYDEGCKKYGSQIPKIERFDIYLSKEKIRGKMISRLEEIL